MIGCQILIKTYQYQKKKPRVSGFFCLFFVRFEGANRDRSVLPPARHLHLDNEQDSARCYKCHETATPPDSVTAFNVGAWGFFMVFTFPILPRMNGVTIMAKTSYWKTPWSILAWSIGKVAKRAEHSLTIPRFGPQTHRDPCRDLCQPKLKSQEETRHHFHLRILFLLRFPPGICFTMLGQGWTLYAFFRLLLVSSK